MNSRIANRTIQAKNPGSLALGAVLDQNNTAFFRVWAPRLSSLHVVFPKSSILPLELSSVADGYFEGSLKDCPSEQNYFFRTETGQELPDPISNYQPMGVYGPSQIVDHRTFNWEDQNWTGQSLQQLVLYELHIGTFSPEGSFSGAANLLPYLADLGINAIELMPIAQFSGQRNWGYDGVFPFAPQNSYGSPDELKAFVNSAHKLGISVLLDVVYNHLGPEGNCFGEFGPYFTDRYHTPWGDAINFDGPFCDHVRHCVIENALHWYSRYHIDGFRVDAIQAISDSSPTHILTKLCNSLHDHAQHSGRQVHLIAESDANDPRVVEGPEVRGFGFDAQWNDDFHLSTHAYLTGERHGLYQDFGRLSLIAKTIQKNIALDGQYSHFRCKKHGAPADHLPPHKFVVFNQNHDHIGNRAYGDRFAAANPIDKQKCALSLLLLSPFVPLIFMGEEYGEIAPFHYFVDHQDQVLCDEVRAGRIRDLRQFWDSPRPQNPHELETFKASRLRLGRRHTPAGQALLALVKDLIAMRSCFADSASLVDRLVKIDESHSRLSVEIRLNDEPIIKSAFNLGSQCIPCAGIVNSDWNLELSTAWSKYSVDQFHDANDSSLKPLSAHVYIAA